MEASPGKMVLALAPGPCGGRVDITVREGPEGRQAGLRGWAVLCGEGCASCVISKW